MSDPNIRTIAAVALIALALLLAWGAWIVGQQRHAEWRMFMAGCQLRGASAIYCAEQAPKFGYRP